MTVISYSTVAEGASTEGATEAPSKILWQNVYYFHSRNIAYCALFRAISMGDSCVAHLYLSLIYAHLYLSQLGLKLVN